MATVLSPESRILHYRLLRKIGEGGMGVVYEAEDTRLGRTVAIKLLHPSISEDGDARLRFLREARTVSTLDHPNLCSIYTVEELPDGALLLVMAYYRGHTLAQLLVQRGAFDIAGIRDIGRQAAAGLHAAHMAGIVHRDIKPGNILVLDSGTVKILDFGLSHIADQQQLTVPHQVMGTLAYMPPEQLAGASVDYRADIWALGAVLYEMAAGHSPFQQPTASATMAAISECRYLPLQQIRSDLPKAMYAAVERSLKKEPHERHASAAELMRLLEEDTGEEAKVLSTKEDRSQDLTTTKAIPFATNGADATARTLFPAANGLSGNRSLRDGLEVVEAQRREGLSIAVLPLHNVSPDAENEYFSDGLTDELISALGMLPDLRVVSRTSAFSLKNTTQSIREIGEALGVEVLLEGTVRRSGARVRVMIQLTHVRGGYSLWSSRLDRQMADIFELQDEIASSVVAALRETLAPNLSHPNLLVRTPMQADAYEAYLKGRYHWNRRTPEDLQLAGRYFEQALKLDPKSAAAHAGMANFYCLQGTYGVMPPHEAWALARSSSLEAISLDPNQPEGHIGLASVLQFCDWDWEGAYRHILKAIELQPQRGESYYICIAYLILQGRFEEALEKTRVALTYDPLSTPLMAAEALAHVYLGEYDVAILQAQAALVSAPHYVELYYAVGIAQCLKGSPHEAIKTFEDGIERSHTSFLKGWLAAAHAQDGNAEEAQRILDQMTELARSGYPMPLSIAVAATALGQNELALTWLERAADQRDIFAAYIAVWPSLKKLHEEPRYRQLLERMKLSGSFAERSHHAAR